MRAVNRLWWGSSPSANSQANVDAVKKSRQDAYNVGINGTPFAFIGDAVMPGYVDAATVRATVLAQAAKSGK